MSFYAPPAIEQASKHLTKEKNKPMIIEVTQREVYGNTLTYVVDAAVQRSIQKLTGRKSLTDGDILALKELGFTLRLKQITVNL
ncbi:MAG: hypothetical protein CMK36_07925 [Porticoccaceae bacterium]|nr:hypothetical protein [Porticoccaceae bacterium]